MASVYPAAGGPLNIISNLTAFLLAVRAASVAALIVEDLVVTPKSDHRGQHRVLARL